MKLFKRKADSVQAGMISAWIEKENEDGSAWITVLNESTTPVTKMILSTVNIQTTPSSGKEAPNECRTYLNLVPPGKYFTRLMIHHGMHFLSGVEIAFIDNAGQSWLRDWDGLIIHLKQQPSEYYNLSLPISWESPLTKMG